MNQKVHCSFYLFACFLLDLAVLRLCAQLFSHSIDDILKGLPNREIEFFENYLQFVNSKNITVFMPVAITCIIIGLIGNACFIFFFGRPSSFVYYTRDAVYLRRISKVDIVICVVVLPYAIVFEAGMVDNNSVCKVMEYIRHVLICTSHLLLTSYSMEFTESNRYNMGKMRLDRATMIIFLFALIISVPVLFIFEVGSSNDFSILLEKNASKAVHIVKYPAKAGSPTEDGLQPSGRYAFFSPRFCHLSFNYDTTASNYETVRTLQSIYIMVFGFILFLSMFAAVYKFMQYVESKPLLGRNSIFVHAIEVKNPEVSATLKRMSVVTKEKNEQRRLQRQSLMESRSSLAIDMVRAKYEKKDSQNKLDLANIIRQKIKPSVLESKISGSFVQITKSGAVGQTGKSGTVGQNKSDTIRQTPKSGVIRQSNESEIKFGKKLHFAKSGDIKQTMKPDAVGQTGKTVNKSNIQGVTKKYIISGQSKKLSVGGQNKASSKDKGLHNSLAGSSLASSEDLSSISEGESSVDFQIQTSEHFEPRNSPTAVENLSESIDYLNSHVSLVGFLFGCECFKSEPKSIQQLSSSYPSVGHKSYKKSFMWLIVLDIVVASMTAVIYLISNERSVTLNLIHIKSVFAFYIISFIHPELRSATWGSQCIH